MVPIIAALLLALPHARSQEHVEHREFQYNSPVDPETGRYNFAYDTGNDNDIAHSLHMQYQDADGIVRGRYGYTDPRGKLRMVEYEAGPGGFVARGDVGPDQFPHGQAPGSTSDVSPQEVISSYNAVPTGDFDLDPAPIQMAGWDPASDSMAQPPSDDGSVQPPANEGAGLESENGDGISAQYATINVTSEDALEVYGPELGFYRDRYPRIIYSPINENNGLTPESTAIPTTNSESPLGPTQDNNDQSIHSIDVDPDEIRQAAGSPVRRSAGDQRSIVRRSGVQGQASGSPAVRIPASYRNYYSRYYHDHDAEARSRQTHDHDAEARSRQTHDHDAERRYYRPRQTHDHDAEIIRYRARQTHDHDAERHQNHDHAAERSAYYRRLAAERAAYYRSLYKDRGDNYPRRIFYRDSHSMEPHEHYDNPVYRNYRDHQHSDRHLYGRYRNYVYPATAKPRQLQYIPADKYHDKRYYWTND